MEANPYLNAKWVHHVAYVMAQAVHRPMQRLQQQAYDVLAEHAPMFGDLVELAVLKARREGRSMTRLDDNGLLCQAVSLVHEGLDGKQDYRDILTDASNNATALLDVLARNKHLLNAVKSAMDGAPPDPNAPITPGSPDPWQELRDLTEEEKKAQQKGQGNDPTAAMERLNIWCDVDKVREAAAHNPQLLEILQAAGRMTQMARAIGMARQEGEGEELTGMTVGADVMHAPPDLLVKLKHPTTRRQVLYDLVSRSADNFETTTDLESASGPIVVVLDGSGSMGGQPNILARGAALAVLAQARIDQRDVHVITFGAAHQRSERSWLFKTRPFNPSVGQDLINFATAFEGYGGTDFETHLTRAEQLIDADPTFNVADIMMITDGQASLSEKWKASFKSWKQATGVCSYLINVGTTNKELARLMEAHVNLNPHADASANEATLADYVQLLQHRGMTVDGASQAA